MVSAKLGLLVVDLINNTRTVHVLVTNSAYQCSGMAETIVHGPADSFLEGAPASPSTAFNYVCVCARVCMCDICVWEHSVSSAGVELAYIGGGRCQECARAVF